MLTKDGPGADGSAPAPRPPRADALRNRAKVLAAAQSALFEQGQSVSMDEIARRAGVGPGTIYRHFPAKEALFEAVYINRVQELTAYAESLLDPDSEPGAVFFGFLEHMVAEGSDKRALVEALTGAGIDISEVGRSVADELRRVIGKMLRRAQQAGRVRPDIGVPEVMRLVAGMSLTSRQSPDGLAEPDLVLRVICDGLRARPTEA